MAPPSSKGGSRCNSSTHRSPVSSVTPPKQQHRLQQQRMQQEVRKQLVQSSNKRKSGSRCTNSGASNSSNSVTAAAPTAGDNINPACDRPSNKVVQQQQQVTRENPCSSTSSKRSNIESHYESYCFPSGGLVLQQQQHQAASRHAAGLRIPGTSSATARAAVFPAVGFQSVTAAYPLAGVRATATGATVAPFSTAIPTAILPSSTATVSAATPAAGLLLAGGRAPTTMWIRDAPNGRRRVASAHTGGTAIRKGLLVNPRQQQRQKQQGGSTGMGLFGRMQAWFGGGSRSGDDTNIQTKKNRSPCAAVPAASSRSLTVLPSHTSTMCSTYPRVAPQRSYMASLLSPAELLDDAPAQDAASLLRLSSLPSGFVYPARAVPVLQQQCVAPAAASSPAGATSSCAITRGAAAAKVISPASGSQAETAQMHPLWGSKAQENELQQCFKPPCVRSLTLDSPLQQHHQLVEGSQQASTLQQVESELQRRLQEQQEHNGEKGRQRDQQFQRKQREQAQLLQQFLQQQQERYTLIRRASLSNDLQPRQGYVTFTQTAPPAAAGCSSYREAVSCVAATGLHDSSATQASAAVVTTPATKVAAAGAGLDTRATTAGTAKNQNDKAGMGGDETFVVSVGANATTGCFKAAESVVSAEEEKETEEEILGPSATTRRKGVSNSENDAAAAAAVSSGVLASSSSEDSNATDSGRMSSFADRMDCNSSTDGVKRSSDGSRIIDDTESNISREVKRVEGTGDASAAGQECKETIETGAKAQEGKAGQARTSKKSGTPVANAGKRKHHTQKEKTSCCKGELEDNKQEPNDAQQQRVHHPPQQKQQQTDQRKQRGSKARPTHEQQKPAQQQQQRLISVAQTCEDIGVVAPLQKSDEEQEEVPHNCKQQQRTDKDEREEEALQQAVTTGKTAKELQPEDKSHQGEHPQRSGERSALSQRASMQQQIAEEDADRLRQLAEYGALERTREKQSEEIYRTTATAGTEEEEGDRVIADAVGGNAAEKARPAAALGATSEEPTGTRTGEGGCEEIEASISKVEATATATAGDEVADVAAADIKGTHGAGGTVATSDDRAAENGTAGAAAQTLRDKDRKDERRGVGGAVDNDEEAVMLPFGQAYPEGILKGCKKVYEVDEDLQTERERVVQVLLIHETPDVYLLPHLLTHSQCRHIINLCATRWQKSRTSKGRADESPSTYYSSESCTRTSQSARLRPAETPVVAAVEEIAAAFSGCSVDHLEPLSVVKYEDGEAFKEHHDGAFRSVTLLIYLNDVEEGGETEFPYLHLKVTPTQGWGVMWRNAVPECEIEGKSDSSTESNSTKSNSTESNSSSRRMCIDPRLLHAGLPPRNGASKYVVNCFFNDKPIRSAIARAEAALAAQETAAAAVAARETMASQEGPAEKLSEGQRLREATKDSRAMRSAQQSELPPAAFSLVGDTTTPTMAVEEKRGMQQLGYRMCNSFETTTTSTVATTPSESRQPPCAAQLLRLEQQGVMVQQSYVEKQQQQQRLPQTNLNVCQKPSSRLVENAVRAAASASPGVSAARQKQQEPESNHRPSGNRESKSAVAGSPSAVMATSPAAAENRSPRYSATAALRRTGVSTWQPHSQLPQQSPQVHSTALPTRSTCGAAGAMRGSSSAQLSLSSNVSMPRTGSFRKARGEPQTAAERAVNSPRGLSYSMQASNRGALHSSAGSVSAYTDKQSKIISPAYSTAFTPDVQGSFSAGGTSGAIERVRGGQAGTSVQARGTTLPSFSSSTPSVHGGFYIEGNRLAAAPAGLFPAVPARAEGQVGYALRPAGYLQQAGFGNLAVKSARSSVPRDAGSAAAAALAAHAGVRSGTSIPLFPGATPAATMTTASTAAAPMRAAQPIATGIGRGLDFFAGRRFIETQGYSGGRNPGALNPFNLQGNNSFFSSAPAFMMVFGPDGVPQMKPLNQRQIEEGVGKHLLYEALKHFRP